MGLYVSMLRSSSSALRVSSDAAAAEEEEAAMVSEERSDERGSQSDAISRRGDRGCAASQIAPELRSPTPPL